jgi:hypothetical protein
MPIKIQKKQAIPTVEQLKAMDNSTFNDWFNKFPFVDYQSGWKTEINEENKAIQKPITYKSKEIELLHTYCIQRAKSSYVGNSAILQEGADRASMMRQATQLYKAYNISSKHKDLYFKELKELYAAYIQRCKYKYVVPRNFDEFLTKISESNKKPLNN